MSQVQQWGFFYAGELDYRSYDFAAELDEGETVATIAGVDLDSKGGLVKEAETISDSSVVLRLSGGTADRVSRTAITITTSAGRRLKGAIDMPIYPAPKA